MFRKNLIFILFIAGCNAHLISFAQLVECRPKMCMIDYNYHDDRQLNSDMLRIQKIRPEILIDNTPGGYWKGQCLPFRYTPLGIEVFSYISGGYEGTRDYKDKSLNDLASNLARIDKIAEDGATGVFLDEVSNQPSPERKIYLTAISDRCKQKKLKLIFNPGTSIFDPWLMNFCDFIMTDERYNGTRAPTASEKPFINKILVVSENIESSITAKEITQGAQKNGFAYSYACKEYINLPVWLEDYAIQIISQKPETPVITFSNGEITSNFKSGNQWYEISLGIIEGETNQTFRPKATGVYYTIVNNAFCNSNQSNKINFVVTNLEPKNDKKPVLIYPNPVIDKITLKINDSTGPEATLYLYNYHGKLLFVQKISSNTSSIDLSFLPSGQYFVKVITGKNVANYSSILKR